MSCIGDAWCPECKEIIYGNGCMCGLRCDRGEPRHQCYIDAPDGIHPRRQYGQPHPTQLMETRNGWAVGWNLKMGGEWLTSEPYHPTKSRGQLRVEDILKPTVGSIGLMPRLIPLETLDNGGGI